MMSALCAGGISAQMSRRQVHWAPVRIEQSLNKAVCHFQCYVSCTVAETQGRVDLSWHQHIVFIIVFRGGATTGRSIPNTQTSSALACSTSKCGQKWVDNRNASHLGFFYYAVIDCASAALIHAVSQLVLPMLAVG